MAWPVYVALGDSLSAGRGDLDADGRKTGWPARLAGMLSARTGEPCTLTNLAVDGATAAEVLEDQFPAVAALRPDLVSVTVGMNDIRRPGFEEAAFASDLKWLLDGLAAMSTTLVTSTLPDLTDRVPELQDRLRLAGEVIRAEAAFHRALCVDAWAMPALRDPALYSEDRLHLNARGHQLLATTFAELLTP